MRYDNGDKEKMTEADLLQVFATMKKEIVRRLRKRRSSASAKVGTKRSRPGASAAVSTKRSRP